MSKSETKAEKNQTGLTELASPFGTGGGGENFENSVQTLFTIFMLVGGVPPCIRPWPVKEIKFQGKYAGYQTDDFIACAEEPNGSGRAKLFAQVKHTITISTQDPTFKKVIASAWTDFKNDAIFDKNTDAFALITGPLSANDTENARVILEWARTSPDAQDFLTKVDKGKFSNDIKKEKLKAFREQLKQANGGVDVTDDEFWQFLKKFHLIGYDFDVRSGADRSMIDSILAMVDRANVLGLWGMVATEVGYYNQNAGTLTVDAISPDIQDAFAKRHAQTTIPEQYVRPDTPQPPTSADVTAGDKGDALIVASLLGGWNDASKADKEAIKQLLEEND